MEDSCLLEELQTLRQWQHEASRSRLELIESHERRERELAARLDQAQEIIETGRWELARVQKLNDEQRLALNLEQEQHQSRLRELQESLSEARREIERGAGDLHGLRQRCAFLEQDRDHRERRVGDLEHQLQATREELEHRSAELAAARQHCEELQEQRQQSERESATRTETLEHELQAAREELTAAQQRCEELEQQRLQSERESAARTESLEHELHVAREELGRQRDAAREAAEAEHRTFVRELETQRLRDESAAMQQMLEELPDIYEHKFRQRLQPLLEQRDWLLHENSWLRAELPAARPGLEAALEPEPAALAPAAPRRDLLQSLRALLPFGRLGLRSQARLNPEADQHAGSGAGTDQPGTEQLSSGADDGPPTDASAGPRRR